MPEALAVRLDVDTAGVLHCRHSSSSIRTHYTPTHTTPTPSLTHIRHALYHFLVPQEVVELLPSRIRRRFSRGITRKHTTLLKKLRKAVSSAHEGERRSAEVLVRSAAHATPAPSLPSPPRRRRP